MKPINALVVFAALLLLFGCASRGGQGPSGGQQTGGQGTNITGQANQTNESETEPLLQYIEEQMRAREEMKVRKTDLPAIFFQNLPPWPEDLYKIRSLVYYGKIMNLVDLEEKYYKQPEFIPTFDSVVPLIKDPPRGRQGVVGYGAYPADTRVTTSAGSEFTVATFFYTGWLVQTYQGIKVVTTYQATAEMPYSDLNGTYAVTQDPNKTAEYFEVSFDPGQFLIEPTFPIMDSNWIQKVKVSVKVKENTPQGRYVIGVVPVSPDEDKSLEWMLSVKHNGYVPAGGMSKVSRPLYQMDVTVA
ncbi:MAG: hypothetical protein NT157_02885 [Candidatus Micrarchaeota archaeon]|nr:hypothetical protein [Candidatus Micrarchaeota archaeon]